MRLKYNKVISDVINSEPLCDFLRTHYSINDNYMSIPCALRNGWK